MIRKRNPNDYTYIKYSAGAVCVMAYKIKKERVVLAAGIAAAVLIVMMAVIIAIALKGGRSEKNSVFSEQTTTAETTLTTTSTVTTTIMTTTQPVTTIAHIDEPECRGAALYAMGGKKMLYSDHIDDKVAPASLTKLLTAAVALKYVNAEAVFRVGSEQALVHENSSLCGVVSGDELTLRDLITGLLMSSGNDAAYTIAVSTARAHSHDPDMTDYEAVDYFCGMMNSFAEFIGMEKSHFSTPDGWDDADQYTTVSDLLILTEYALSVPEISDIVGVYSKDVVISSGKPLSWTNSNELLDPNGPYYTEGVCGVKTGTTDVAGNSLIAVYKKNRRTYISVVVGCNTDDERYQLTKELLSHCE
ncbi:D-alanyl-D-alanine carboxypeptidase family protein [Ruminococcus flavefaciens]|uniref:D-alanyl-D-alanine carboxypeptidase family protein n=1 Tax=Ruminococcus flavefaciens TaxID=1265 RepID=UPI0004654D42|nr:D-alanyl-D-alanine carboxypeptidase [Ruminococcus flavefaciens]